MTQVTAARSTPLLEVMKAEATGPRLLAMPPEVDLSKRLRDYLQRAGVTRAELFANDATRKQVRFYDLRATGITWMALRGDEPLRIMQRAGHKEFSTTLGYVREAESLGFVGDVFPPLPPLGQDTASRPRKNIAPDIAQAPFAAPQLRGTTNENVASSAGFEPA